MRVLISVLVALLGAIVGAAIGVAITYGVLSGEDVNALVWAVTGAFFCIPLAAGGAVATGVLCRRLFPGIFASSRHEMIGASVAYGIGASAVVLLIASASAVYYATRDTSGGRDLLAGELCRKSGIRFNGAAGPGVTICFTLSSGRSELDEIAWRFSLKSGCGGGGATLHDSSVPLERPGRIQVPGVTGRIRGARASGVLEDPDVCPGRTFKWSARETVR